MLYHLLMAACLYRVATPDERAEVDATKHRLQRMLGMRCVLTVAKGVQAGEQKERNRQKKQKEALAPTPPLVEKENKKEKEENTHTCGARKFGCGYHYLVRTDGRTRHTDTRTPEQRIAMQALLTVLHTVWPAATLHGHRDYNPAKACPCFDARTEYASIFDPDQDYE